MVCNEIFASLHSNAAARCAGCTYKCGFRRKMSNGPTDSAPLYQTLVRACVRVRNFRGTEFLFNSRESNYRPRLCTVTTPFRKTALTFLMGHRRGGYFVVSLELLNARKFGAASFGRTRIIIDVHVEQTFAIIGHFRFPSARMKTRARSQIRWCPRGKIDLICFNRTIIINKLIINNA